MRAAVIVNPAKSDMADVRTRIDKALFIALLKCMAKVAP